MTKQLEALIARAKHIVENGGLLARDTSLQLIAALEQAQQTEETLKSRNRRLDGIISAAEKRIAELQKELSK